MILYPREEKTRRELFALLGIQGGTCHQIPDMIRPEKVYSGLFRIRLPYHFIVIIGGRLELHNVNGEYINWADHVPMSDALRAWFIENYNN